MKISGGTFDEEGHCYADPEGQRVLSVTQVFDVLGLIDFSHVSEEDLAYRAQVGTAVHRAVELLCRDQLDWNSLQEDLVPYVVSVEQWMRQAGFVSEAQEQRGIATVNGMRFGYQFDHLGRIRLRGVEHPVILDLKTTATLSPTCKLQTAAYVLSQPKREKPYVRMVLHVNKKGKCTPHFYRDAEDANAFLYMLYCATWKLNHGLAGKKYERTKTDK